MKKRILAMLLVSAMGVATLAGCGGDSKTDNSAATDDKATNVADTQESKEDAGSHDETIVVYTNSGSEGRDDYLTKKAAEAGFTIQVVGLGASEVTERYDRREK